LELHWLTERVKKRDTEEGSDMKRKEEERSTQKNAQWFCWRLRHLVNDSFHTERVRNGVVFGPVRREPVRQPEKDKTSHQETNTRPDTGCRLPCVGLVGKRQSGKTKRKRGNEDFQ
jgi:hypothetical protein